MSSIKIDHITKEFSPDLTVLSDLNLTIEDGSFTVLLGPSGCGKSTLLRIVAGLESATSGRIFSDEEDITNLQPGERDLAMVFQNYALYPHMNVYKNIEYGLKVAKMSKEQRKEKVLSALEMVQLSDQKNKMPAQMSGGQRQRVALARAIVKSPNVFLMDEPLSNLDAKLRNQMRESIGNLYRQLGTTFLYVTHDQVEAMSMGTHIVILNKGEIMQSGMPREIYTNPQNLFVAGFIGSPPCGILSCDDFSAAIRCEKVVRGRFDNGINLRAAIRSIERLGEDSVYLLDTELGMLHMKESCIWDECEDNIDITLPYSDIFYFNEEGERVESSGEMHRKLESRLSNVSVAV